MSVPLKVLLADDINPYEDEFVAIMRENGMSVDVEKDGAQARDRILSGAYDILICEIVLPTLGGKELVKSVLIEYPTFPIFIFTRHPNMLDAFQFAQIGVLGYFTRDDNLSSIIENIKSTLASKSDIKSLDNVELQGFQHYQSRNAEMESIFDTAITRVAQAPSTVLITGESGTGKELLAKTIHLHSKRADKEWVAVNCAALPENLIESELFGHEKGSFTGATARHQGRFEKANNGTFFLDEIGDLSLTVQTKLLRVLQERTIERVGGDTEIPVNVRIIAATHKNLRDMVNEGSFREDLFYRLSVIHLELPPLRDRKEDIPGLAQFS